KRSPSRGKALHFSEKLCSCILTQNDECGPGIAQALAVRMSEQSHKPSGLAVSICPYHHKGGFDEALGLQPKSCCDQSDTARVSVLRRCPQAPCPHMP